MIFQQGLCCLALSLLSVTVAHAENPTRHVLMLGIDGCRTDALQAANTPNIDHLVKNGTISTNTSILGTRPTENDTVSGPSWSSIYTGVWSDKHGVLGNNFEKPNYDNFPHFFSRLREVHPEAVTGSFSDWDPIAENIVSGATVLKSPKPPEPKGAEGYRLADVEVTKEAIKFLTTQTPMATCVYLGQVDETGHAKGFHPNVSEYIAAIERVDEHVGELMQTIQSRPTYENEEWLVVITTDHGGEGLSHGDGHDNPNIRQVFLIASGPGITPVDPSHQTYIVDAVATSLAWLNVPIRAEWQLDGTPFAVGETTPTTE